LKKQTIAVIHKPYRKSGMESQKLLNLTNLKAVLIDLDGTLVDSMPMLYSTYTHFLKQSGYKGSREEFDSLIGATLPDIVGTLATRYNIETTSRELMQLYLRMLEKHYSSELQLFPGAMDFILYAKEQELKTALVTSAPNELVTSFLEGHNLTELFDVVMTPETVRRGKPSPEIFEKALQELGIDASEGIVIEDSSHGVRAAVEAGIPTIKLTHGDETRPDKYCILLKDWFEVLYLFQSRYS
jgi:HAD superfamily hydrolase (TIGR01509 family)